MAAQTSLSCALNGQLLITDGDGHVLHKREHSEMKERTAEPKEANSRTKLGRC